MGLKRTRTGLILWVVLLQFGGSAAIAAAAEPLVITHLADPDPNYVPPPGEQHPGRQLASADPAPVLDTAIQDFRRAIGQAALLQRQAIEAKCHSSAPVPAEGSARWAWEANCRYERR